MTRGDITNALSAEANDNLPKLSAGQIRRDASTYRLIQTNPTTLRMLGKIS